MSHGRKKDEQNVRTPRSDKGDHRGEGGKKNWEMCRKWRGKVGCRPGRRDMVGEWNSQRNGSFDRIKSLSSAARGETQSRSNLRMRDSGGSNCPQHT